MALKKTTELINSCDAAFKRSGLLRLAEAIPASSRLPTENTSLREFQPAADRTNNVLDQTTWNGSFHNSVVGSAALNLKSQVDVHELEAEARARHAVHKGLVRPLGISAVDAILPDGGLPTGKVIELNLSGGAACGTQLALWACRAAQQQAELNGTDSWNAFIDPSASLHAPGVLSNGVSLPRLLVVRPNLEDVERVALRLSEANVFSVIIIDLVGVPWLPARTSVRSTPQRSHTTRASELELSSVFNADNKRQNWNRTVRQLALRLEHSQAQVFVLTSAEMNRSLPLPVALRLHMRADARGVNLQVVKESQGRVGAQGTVPWSAWGHERIAADTAAANTLDTVSAQPMFSRAKTLPLPEYLEPSYQGLVGPKTSCVRLSEWSGDRDPNCCFVTYCSHVPRVTVANRLLMNEL